MIINKEYRSPFVVEQSKLTRLLSVVDNALQPHGSCYSKSFEARLADERSISTDSLQHILELDNSERSRVGRLIIKCQARPKPAGDPVHAIEIDFNGRPKTEVRLKVTSADWKVARETISVAEEQIERMLERGFFHNIFVRADETFIAIVMMMVTVTLIGGLIGGIFGGAATDSQISRSMWLTQADLVEIAPNVQNGDALAPEQGADILTRQIRNLIDQHRPSPVSAFTDWRIILMVLPAVIAVGALFALRFCYPPAVFLWGDAEEWYKRLLARRTWIWNVVVVTLGLSIIANLAVFAFGSFISARTI
jgi:hypothetical protein